MSLNGLDNPNINEAYKAALADAGGWLLLRYVSRDEVELLRRGSSGVVEIRDAISQYLEPSPLYGFIQYRRRKVLIKYIPEKTSRLLQARVSVHFLAVCERFAPYDAEFPIATAAELKETALSAACSLHTASASISSSNSSLRRRRLAEIMEDNEVTPHAAENNGQSAPHELGGLRPQQNEESTTVSMLRSAAPQERLQTQPHGDVNSPISTPDNPTILPKKPEIGRSNTAATVPLTRTRDEIEYDLRPSEDRRQSSQSTRPVVRDLYESSAYGSKPKVKLGPRPSLDVDRRPRTSGSFFRQSESRPISTLPAGIRTAPRKTAPTRPKSQNTNHSSEHPIARPAVPKLPSYTADAPLRPVARLSNVMPPPTPASSMSSKSGAMTLEKQRLMKALQLRRKQMTKVSQERAPEPQIVSLAPRLNKRDPEPLANSEVIREDVDRQTDPIKVVSTSDPIPIGEIAQPDSSPASLAPSLEAASTSASSLSDLRVPEHKEKVSESTELAAVQKVTEDASTPCNDNVPLPMQPKPDVAVMDKFTEAQNKPQTINDIAESPTELENIPSVFTNELPLEPDYAREGEPSEPVATSTFKHAGLVRQEPETLFEPALSTELHVTDNREDPKARYHGIVRRVSKRRGIIELAPVDTSADDSDENFLSDDSLMEELNLATVEEAKPIQVSKSPITPIFQIPGEHRRSGARMGSNYLRNVSNPVSSSLGNGMQGMSSRVRASEIPRSVSATHANNADSQGGPTAMAKKVNVSSGISKRIKALEQLSSREASATTSSLPSSAHSNASSSFNGLRQASLRSPNARSTSKSPQPESASQRVHTPEPSSPLSPERHLQSLDRLDSQQTGIQEPGDRSTEPVVKSNRTAWGQKSRDLGGRDRSFGEAANRLGSPGLVQYTSMGNARTTERSQPVLGANSSRNDMSHMAQFVVPPALLNSPSSIVSASTDGNSSSERSKSEPITPSSTQELGSNGQRSPEERKDEKKESRASRLFRRMSSMSSASRKSLVQAISPTLKEESNPFDLDITSSPRGYPPDLRQRPPRPSKVDVGDVNIQFPDTLLWKRRCMVIDEQGYMVLSPPKSDQSSRSVTKRYHFSEFRPPFLPDQDRQELPNSVIMDFCDSSTLQCAAENPTGQAYIYKVLYDSYCAWTA